MLTNVRQAVLPQARLSRGALVTQALRCDNAHELMTGLDPEAYGGFNLVWGNLNTGHWHWMSNRHPQTPHADQRPALHHRPLGEGLYGLSNASLDTPWPKTLALKSALKAAMQARHEHEQLAQLAPVLTRATPEHEEALPRTGVPAAMERALSSPFVRMPERGYGTRSTLWMRVRETPVGWQADLDEWTHDPAAPGPALSPERHRRLQVTAA
ncbi:MAG: NRDE family protein [Burkholderiaceae bacterium]